MLNLKIQQNPHSHAMRGNEGYFRAFFLLLLILLLLPFSLPLQAKIEIENNAVALLNKRSESKQPTWQVINDAPFRVTAAPSSLMANGETLEKLGFSNIDELLASIEKTTTYNSIAFSPDGQLIVVGSDDNSVKLLDVQTFKLIHSFKGHSSNIKTVAFSPDGLFILSTSRYRTAKLWDIQNRKLVDTFNDGEGGSSFSSIAFSPDGKFFVTDSEDNTIKLWDIQNNKIVHTFKGHSAYVNSVDFSLDGRFIISGSEDKTIKLWDVLHRRLIHTFEGHSFDVLSVDFSSNGGFIASSSIDNTVKVWNVKNKKLVYSFEGHSKEVLSVSFGPKGRFIASGSMDGTVKLWDVLNKTLVHTFDGHSGYVNSVIFSPDGRFIASCSSDGTVKLWNVQYNKIVHSFEGKSSSIPSVAFSSDKQFMVSGSDGGNIKLWDIQNQYLVHTFQGHAGRVNSVAFSNDGHFIISGGVSRLIKEAHNSIKLWDVKSRQLLYTFEGHRHGTYSVDFSENERFIASGGMGGGLKIWDIQGKKLVHTFDSGYGFIFSLNFNHDGKYIASGSSKGAIKIWDIENNKLFHTFKGHPLAEKLVDIFGSGSSNDFFKLRAALDQKNPHTSEGHSSIILSVKFSPDGQYIASGSLDDSVKLWDVQNKKLIHTFIGHSNHVNSVAFSPDGKFIASGSSDNSIKLWDIQHKSLTHTFKGHLSDVNSVVFSTNGEFIVSGSEDNTIKLWNIQNKSLESTILSSRVDSWLWVNKNNEVFRSENGGFLRKKTENNDWLPILPTKLSSESNFSISINQDSFSVSAEQGKDTSLIVNITNNSSKPAYWLKLKPTKSEDEVIRLDEPDNQLKPKGKSIWKPFHINKLEAGETATLHARISTNLKFPADFIQSGIRPLTITVVSANGTEVSQSIEVDVKLPKLEWTKATLEPDGSSLKVKLQNTGTAGFHEGYVQLFTEGLDKDSAGEHFTPEQTIPDLKPGESTELAFILPKQANLLYLFKTLWHLELLQLRGQSNQLPIFAWNLTTQRISWLVFWLLALAVGLFVLAFVYLRLYRHPLLVELSNDPEKLQQIPPEQLIEAHRRLKKSNRLASVLVKGKVSAITLGKGIDFINSDTNEEKVQSLADRLGTHSTYIQLNLWQLKLPENFPLNLQHCLVYFPAKKTAAMDVFNELKGCADVNRTATLLIGHDSEYQRKLYATSKDLSNKWVAPSGRELTKLLLSPEPENTLADIFAGQLALTLLSPYQLGGGVNNKNVFFGRMEIIDHVLNREPTNYLIAGGRQLGKSSLLKALERRFKKQGNVTCFYLALSNEVLIPRLLSLFDLPKEAGIEGLADYARQSKKPLVFLIDEADKFIRQEREQDYHILNTLRQMSEEGHCFFILAGFWELYQHAVLDYQSPLKNFAETIQIGALENKACWQLATLPMKTLRIEYDNSALVAELLEKTGGRANLIAITCHQIIEKLKPNQRVITELDVNEALQSEKTLNALRGWGAMTDDEQVCRLDRIIVYATIDQNQFTFEQLVKILINQNINPGLQLIEHSLARLKLGFVLGNELNNEFSYQVPLFREMILNESPVTKLKIEIDEWNASV